MKYTYKNYQLELYVDEGNCIGVSKSLYAGLNKHYIYQDTFKQVKKEFRNYINNFLHKKRI